MACIYCDDTGIYADTGDPFGVQEVYCSCAKGMEMQGAVALSRAFTEKHLPQHLVEKWRIELAAITSQPKKTVWDWLRDPAL